MPFFKRLRTLDWPALLAELVLVFVGITAALWFENLNDARRDAKLETAVLGELVTALESDTSDLHFNIVSSARTIASIDTVLAYLDARRPYDPSLAAHFGRATRVTNFFSNSSAYESLKSLGLGLVTNDTLRVAITRYYELQARELNRIEELFVNDTWMSEVEPQMVSKFDYRFILAPAVPNDYAALTRDLRYKAMLRTMREITSWKASLSQSTLDEAGVLLQAIATELATR